MNTHFELSLELQKLQKEYADLSKRYQQIQDRYLDFHSPNTVHELSPLCLSRLYSNIFNETAVALCLTDREGKMVEINDAFCRLSEYAKGELLGKSFLLLVPDRLKPHAQEMHDRFFTTGGMPQEWTVCKKTGEQLTVFAQAGKIEVLPNTFCKITSVIDISELKKIEGILREKEQTVRSLLNATLDSAFLVSPDGEFLEANEIGANRLGMDTQSLIGRNAKEIFPEPIYKSRLQTIRHVAKTKKPYRTQDCRGDYYFDNYFSPIFDEGGQVTQVAIFAQDITLQKQHEAALQETNSRYETLLANFPNGAVFMFDSELRYTIANGAGLREIGLSREQIEGKTIWDFLPEVTCRALEPNYRAALHGESRVFTLPFQDFIYEIRTLPIENERGEIIGGMAVTQNITERIHTENQLKESIDKFKALFDLDPDAVFLETSDGNIVDCNLTAEQMTGYSREELLQLTVFDLVPEEYHGQFQSISLLESSQSEWYYETHNRRKGGEHFPVEVKIKRIHLDNEPIFLAVVRDIAARKEYEQKLQLFEKVFNNALEGISITDKTGTIIAINNAFTSITGYESDEVVGNNPRVLKSDRHSDSFYKNMWKDLQEKGQWEGEIWNRRKSGETYPEWLSISDIRDADGDISHYVAVFHDITDMKHKEEQIQHQAYHDALTDLPNRLLLHDRIQVAISHANRTQKKIAIFFMDLDNFKTINDSLGHAIGDRLLQETANRLLRIMRTDDTVSRLGGDEFVIMVEDIDDESRIIQIAQRIQETLSQPFQLDGHDFFVTTSIGITMFPGDGENADILLKNADIAMYRAKEKGKNQYRWFTQTMNDRVQQRLHLEGSLRKAVQQKEFTVFYQPRIDLATNTIRGMEALVRWQTADGKIISPADFIPIAEETGMIIPIGEQVLETACQDTKEWLASGFPDLIVSVNLSPTQFIQKDITQQIRGILERTQFPASHLEVEITESTIMTNIEASIETMKELTDLGIKLSIDDFGTGYSSLYYLKKFPLNILKIDRSFIMDLETDQNDANLVETIVLLAKKLNLQVVAEGVETQYHLGFLKNLECEEAQGYYFSRPISKQEFTQYIETYV